MKNYKKTLEILETDEEGLINEHEKEIKSYLEKISSIKNKQYISQQPIDKFNQWFDKYSNDPIYFLVILFTKDIEFFRYKISFELLKGN